MLGRRSRSLARRVVALAGAIARLRAARGGRGRGAADAAARGGARPRRAPPPPPELRAGAAPRQRRPRVAAAAAPPRRRRRAAARGASRTAKRPRHRAGRRGAAAAAPRRDRRPPPAATAPAARRAAAPPRRRRRRPAAARRAAPREVLAEAEKLLGQGEVGDACARGEEAKRLSPKLAAVYKFLGKCYMRAGRTREANDNYKQYLELAPNAPDAPFIKSMIK